jgi:hypothetical protein
MEIKVVRTRYEGTLEDARDFAAFVANAAGPQFIGARFARVSDKFTPTGTTNVWRVHTYVRAREEDRLGCRFDLDKSATIAVLPPSLARRFGVGAESPAMSRPNLR